MIQCGRVLTVPLRDAEDSLPKRHKNEIPKGLEPTIKWDGKKGYIDTPALAAEPDPAIWSELIADWGLSPDLTEIVEGSVHIRGWDTNVGDGQVQRMRYYRASIRTKERAADTEDIEALCQLVMKYKAPKAQKNGGTGNRAFLILCSDWQAGKDEGGGTEALIERVIITIDKVIERINELIKVGRAPSYIYVVGLGDLIEGCDGHYAQQSFSVDLDRRSQVRIVRRLILRLINELVKNFDIPIIMGAVPGNHGENRKNGKSFTTLTDNDDLAVFEQLGEVFESNPELYANVTVPDFDKVLNPDDLTLTYDIAGVPCSFAHGHQFRSGGGGSQGKIENWWKGQVMGQQAVGSAAILFSGHFHHFLTSEASGRTCFQTPALDGGSKWFTGTSGQNSPAGLLCLGIGLDYGKRGWGDLLII